MTQNNPYKIVDLFSGAGGFSLGFDHPEALNGLGSLGYENIEMPGRGFQTILGVEQDTDARRTFEANFDIDAGTFGDVTDLDFRGWKHADVVIGGPPCQGFSLMNGEKTEDLDDDRNHLWQHFMRAVEEIDPEIFLIENVPRFLKTTDGWGAYTQAKELGYEVIVSDLWAHHFGVPQKRHRVFMIGSKRGTPFFPHPETPQESQQKTVRQAFNGVPDEPSGDNWHVGRRQTDLTKERMKLIPPGGDRRNLAHREDLLPECWKGDYSGHTDCYGRLWWDEPSVTMRKGYTSPMKGRFLHPESNRVITPREGARLQTFPDDFTFETTAKSTMTDQVGNAVPPKLAYELAYAVAIHLEFGCEGILEDYHINDELQYQTAQGISKTGRLSRVAFGATGSSETTLVQDQTIPADD